MENPSAADLLYLAAYMCGAAAFAVGPLVIAFLFAPRSTRNVTNRTRQLVECGVDPIGRAWIRYGISYYLYALIFLAFDVDVLFLFPVALAYMKEPDAVKALVEIALFVGILALAIIYAWRKGVFEWNPQRQSQP